MCNAALLHTKKPLGLIVWTLPVGTGDIMVSVSPRHCIDIPCEFANLARRHKEITFRGTSFSPWSHYVLRKTGRNQLWGRALPCLAAAFSVPAAGGAPRWSHHHLLFSLISWGTWASLFVLSFHLYLFVCHSPPTPVAFKSDSCWQSRQTKRQHSQWEMGSYKPCENQQVGRGKRLMQIREKRSRGKFQ